MELLVATRNQGKLVEMRHLLRGVPVTVMSMADFPNAPYVEEDGTTLAANAAKKACETARFCGVWTIADDSGLFVDALGGRPGVQSARYAGPGATSADLCRKLLHEMADVPEHARTAHFGAVIAFASREGELQFCVEGRCEGIIARRMHGEEGFGYDPVFRQEPGGPTFAELSREAKGAISHRGRALRAFSKVFGEWLSDREA